MSETPTDDTDQVEVIRIEQAHDGYVVFHDGATDGFDFTDRIRINGHHASVSDELEIEVESIEIVQTHTTEQTAVISVGGRSACSDTYWYKAGGKHYFLQAEDRDGELYFRKVTPLISQDSRGYYRVRQWKRVSDDMVDAFHEDHRERAPPSDWANARKEQA